MTKKELGNTAGAEVLPTSHTAAALERVQELRRWREQIPHFTIPTTADETKRLANAASVPPEFVENTTMALASQASLARPDAIPPAVIRELVTYADAYEPLPDELEALAHFVRHSVRAARHTAGSEALATYSIAQRLAKLPATAHLKPYVADMRRALGRFRKATPEQLAKRAAARAAKAAAKAAKKAVKASE
jgi:hypothetical protein